MTHHIKPHAGGLVFLDQPQQRWTFTDSSELMASALFVGHLLEAITDDAGKFDLTYLGFEAKGFESMHAAKSAAPAFARGVLGYMAQLVSDRQENA